MIRFDLGSLEVCEITDKIMAGIHGTEGTGEMARPNLKKILPQQEMANLILAVTRSYLCLVFFLPSVAPSTPVYPRGPTGIRVNMRFNLQFNWKAPIGLNRQHSSTVLPTLLSFVLFSVFSCTLSYF